MPGRRATHPSLSRPLPSARDLEDDGLDAVLRTGVTNMLDLPVVAKLTAQMGVYLATTWIMTHPGDYARGVFGGFQVEGEGETQED